MEFRSEVPLIRPAEPPQRAVFLGNGWTLFGIYLRNILLTIVTLGIYYFWGKNRVRQYVISHAEFDGDRPAWHGTGRELFLGMLKFLLFAAPVYALLIYLQVRWEESPAAIIVSLGGYLLYLLLVPLLMIGSRRYRFSRLSWRGIRFSFRGRLGKFFKLYVVGMLLNLVTLGLYSPYFQTEVRRFLTDNSYFGTTQFTFDGRGRDLFKAYLLLVILFIVVTVVAAIVLGYRMFNGLPTDLPTDLSDPTVLGMLILLFVVPLIIAVVLLTPAWFWFAAFKHRYFWSHTSFTTARFRSTLTAWRLFAQTWTNLLLLIVTVGLAFPWVMVRNARFYFHNVMLEGPLNLTAVIQDAQVAGATVESAADVFDLDLLGIDLPF